MNLNLYTLIGGLVTAAVGGWRYWLTRGRSHVESTLNPPRIQPASGTSVPEGTPADGKEKS